MTHPVPAYVTSLLVAALTLMLAALPGGQASAEHASTHFRVTRDGGSYVAASSSARYTGTLKSVVERAVGDLNGAGGGIVTFSAGTFDLGSDYFRLREISDITFEGQGIDVTTLQNFSSEARDTEPFNLGGAYRVVIRDLTVIAGGTPRNTSDALDFDKGNDSLVERVKITASRGKGIIFDGKDKDWTSAGNTVRDCIVDGVPGDGIQLLASSNNRIEGCTIRNTGKDGIRVFKSAKDAIQPNKPSNDNVITGNTIEDAGINGIEVVSSARNQVTGNRVTNSSDDRSGQDGIRITSADSVSCNDNRVEGNVATDTQAARTQAYGLNITSPLCSRTFVGANDFRGNAVGEIRDRGTDTQYPATPEPETIEIPPSDDTYVRQDQPARNFGGAATLQVDRGPDKISLLNFTVSGVNDRTVTSARLRIFCVDASSVGGIFERASNSWSEATATWDTAPGPGSPSFAGLGRVTAGTWYEVDVPFVTGDGVYSIRVSTTSTNGADYSSKEGGNSPRLILTLD